MIQQKLTTTNGFPFWVLPLLTCIIGSTGIIGTYSVAVYYGHVQPFPYTDITHAAINYPEYIIFRSTLIVTSILIGMIMMIISWWIQIQSQLANVLPSGLNFIGYGGCLAAFLLCLSTASISDGGDMNWTSHVIGATGFFLVMIFIIFTINDNYTRIHASNKNFVSAPSYYAKLGIVLIIFVVALIYLADGLKLVSLPDWSGNAIEWSLTLLVILYVGSFGIDMYNVDGNLFENASQGYQSKAEEQLNNDIKQMKEGERESEKNEGARYVELMSNNL